MLLTTADVLTSDTPRCKNHADCEQLMKCPCKKDSVGRKTEHQTERQICKKILKKEDYRNLQAPELAAKQKHRL